MFVQVGHDPDAGSRRRTRQGKAIRQVRQMRGMSVAELATACGVTQGAISHWEHGRFSPRADMQVAIARALDVPWSMIFGLDAEVAP